LRLCRRLVALAESLSADVEITANDVVVLDLAGRRGRIHDEFAALAIDDIEIWHARAETPDLAHLAACHEVTQGGSIQSVDLERLPLEILEPLAVERGTLGLLRLWGLESLGDFMGLPRQALIDRLGTEAGRWHDLLKGKSCRLLHLHRPPESFFQSFNFEEGATSLEPVIFGMKRLLHVLAARLAARHLAASSLQVRFILESGSAILRQVRFPEPQAAVDGLFAPLQAMLEGLRLEGAITVLELDAVATFGTAAQREWFGRHLPQPERWAETLAKLEALLGPGRVGIPVPPKSFHPDHFTMHPALGATEAIPERTAPTDCPVPLDRYRPPREIAVAYELRERRPWPLALLNGPHRGHIVDRRGPFPASGAWWEPTDCWQRLEWDIQIESRHLLRLVFQTPDRWQLEGVYL
jgi:protein ImuB